MNTLVRAELLKLRTTRTLYGLTAGMAVSVALSVAGGIVGAGKNGEPALATPAGVAGVLSAEQATVVAVVAGILLMAGEYRHNTATGTFLVTPERSRVVRAKLLAAALAGLVLAVTASAVNLVIALPWLVAKDVPFALVGQELPSVLIGTVCATAIYGGVGVGIGALVRNQLAAVGITLGWMLVVENLLVNLLPDVGRWLPLGAAAALMRADTGLLPMWAGGVLLVGYGAVFAVAGARLVGARDVA